MNILTRERIPESPAVALAAPAKEEAPAKNEQWKKGMLKFINDSILNLWSESGARALEYLHSRGLQDDTIRDWTIGFNPLEGYISSAEFGLDGGPVLVPRGITIPCFEKRKDTHISGLKYVKVRRSAAVDGSKYWIIRGGNIWLFGGYTFSNFDYAYLFESELDVLLAWQTGLNLGFASLPANQPLLPGYFQYFQHITDLIVCQDEDEKGRESADKLCARSKNFHRAKPLPFGKDLTEYYQHTQNQEAVIEWLLDQLDLIPRGEHG